MKRAVWPLIVFFILVGFLAFGLRRDPHEIPSPLINKPAPNFRLAQLHQPKHQVSPADLLGQVWILNIWASWCGSCRQEHPVLMDFSRTNKVALIGLNYKDQPEAAKQWLLTNDNPYRYSLVDADGRVGIDFGVYGVPETFLIDAKGVIRYKHIGPVTPGVLEQKLQALQQEQAK